MNLNEIALLFKEIAEKCPGLSGTNFVIMISEMPEPLGVEGYELAIRNGEENFNRETMDTLKKIVEEKKLKLEKKESSLFIFQEKQGSARQVALEK